MEYRYYQSEAIASTIDMLELSDKKNLRPVIDLPTGSGKSVVIAGLCEHYYRQNKKVLVVTHRAELLKQNRDKISHLGDTSFYSAGLGEKVLSPVTFGGIQSLRLDECRAYGFDIVIVDEAHLVPIDPATEYRRLLDGLGLPVVGLTATPYRLDCGSICGRGKPFDCISYSASISELIDHGFLCPLDTPSQKIQIDLGKLVRGGIGDFTTKSNSEALNPRLHDICLQIASVMTNKQTELFDKIETLESPYRALVYTASVDDAHAVAKTLCDLGCSAKAIDGSTAQDARAEALEWFKSSTNAKRILVSCDIMTTGVDAPATDLICLLRGTISPSLYVQILGRGMRTHKNKKSCIVWDFGGNIDRHGPIDKISPREKTKRKPQDDTQSEFAAPLKQCRKCLGDNSINARTCFYCDSIFESVYKHLDTNYSLDQIISGQKKSNTFEVLACGWSRTTSKSGNDMLVFKYATDSNGYPHSEYLVCKNNLLNYHAQKKLRYLVDGAITSYDPDVIEDQLTRGDLTLKKYKTITLVKDGEYKRLVGGEL